MIKIYTDKFIPDKFGAINFGPISLIRPKFKTDLGLNAHEDLHSVQWLSMAAIGPILGAIVYIAQIDSLISYIYYILSIPLLFHGLLYKFSSKYRLMSEVDCYKEQLKYYLDDRTELMAEFLSTKYDLNLSKEQAINLLKN